MADEQAPLPPGQVMMQMIAGFWVSRTVYAAATLGLADLVKEGPKSADELASVTGTDGRSMYRLLRALASVGVFSERADKVFESTPLSDTLQSDVPDSLRYTAMSELGVSHFGPWGELMYSLKTGRPSFDHVFGMPVFEWFGKNADRAKIFNSSMTELTNLVERAVLEAYDFSGCGTIVDVGGGHGGLIASILKKHTNLKGVVYDSPQVAAGAPVLFEERGVAERATAMGGDFFKSVPAGGDTYVMKHIIHDWDDDKCTTLLRHCRGVMKPDGKVLIVDQVLPEGKRPVDRQVCRPAHDDHARRDGTHRGRVQSPAYRRRLEVQPRGADEIGGQRCGSNPVGAKRRRHLFRCVIFVAPMIGAVIGFFSNSQASAI